jgi:hypothetical protein
VVRLDLDVPYHDRHLARQLGARWDAVSRCWFVPPDTDPAPLLGWSVASELVNVRSHHYFLLQREQSCERCGVLSRVLGIALPAGHEVRIEADGEDDWERSDEPTLLCFITQLEPSVRSRLRDESLWYQPRLHTVGPQRYFANHCPWCRTAFEDYRLYATPGLGFDVLCEQEAATISVTSVASGFAGSADHFSLGVLFLDAMTRR